jgi:hypothetical protein
MPDTDRSTPHLDDLSAREDDESWARRDRQSAVDWFDLAVLHMQVSHAYANHQPPNAWQRTRSVRHVEKSDMMVMVPLDLAETIRDCAKDGMGKKQGRHGRYRGGRLYRLRVASVVDWGRARKAELQPQLGSATEAKRQAAEEASEFLLERYGISLGPDTMQRKMEDSDA